MSIQRKLLFSYLSISGFSLLAVCILVYILESRNVERQVLNQLNAISTIQKHRLELMHEKNLESLSLVASRTQLRLSLKNYQQDGQSQHITKMMRILQDAQRSIKSFKIISVSGLDGLVIASTNKLLNKKNSIILN